MKVVMRRMAVSGKQRVMCQMQRVLGYGGNPSGDVGE